MVSTSTVTSSQPSGPSASDAAALAPQPLGVHVLVVGHRVRDRPRDVTRVGEVLDAGHAREREPGDVELVAGQPHLLVDARALDRAVRVARDQREAARRALAAGRPGVAPAGQRPLVREETGVVAEHLAGARRPELAGQAREEQLLGVEDRERSPLLPRRRRQVEGQELGGVGVQAVVDALDVRRDERLRLGRQPGVGPAGGGGDAGTPGEAVPGQPGGAEDLGGGAGRAAAQELQLPGPVPRGDLPLAAREVREGSRAHVRDAPGVPEDPSHVR